MPYYGTDINKERSSLSDKLLDQNLRSIQLDTQTSQIVPLFTATGLNDLMGGTLYNEEDRLSNPEQQMHRAAFQFWPALDKQRRAKQFCEQIGRELYACYLQSQGKQKPGKWIDECALGVRSAALTLAFAHSVPKETLPLLWAAGMIQWNNKLFNWHPLFTSAG